MVVVGNNNNNNNNNMNMNNATSVIISRQHHQRSGVSSRSRTCFILSLIVISFLLLIGLYNNTTPTTITTTMVNNKVITQRTRGLYDNNHEQQKSATARTTTTTVTTTSHGGGTNDNDKNNNNNNNEELGQRQQQRQQQQRQVEVSVIASSSSSELNSFDNNNHRKTFYEIASKTGTDKVQGFTNWERCYDDRTKCRFPYAINPKCRVFGHWYHTMYEQKLNKFNNINNGKFQFLEIGYFNGRGYDAYDEYLPNAEKHSIEISCMEHGPVSEGKWPWGNFASKNDRYQQLLDQRRLHCGDASQYEFLEHIWTTEMKRPNDENSSPPLLVVIDDASHIATHMAITLFFWFPRIEPGGILIIEDIQGTTSANDFRTHLLPQLMKDIHYCGGDPKFVDEPCFPTIQPFIQSIHCELHICVFERNNVPSKPDLSKELSVMPNDALSKEKVIKCLFGPWKEEEKNNSNKNNENHHSHDDDDK